MSERTCSIDGCDRPLNARGWCKPHYRRWSKHGDPLATPTRDYWTNVPDGHKRCRKCRAVKSLGDFYKTAQPYAQGRCNWCKSCALEYKKQWEQDRSSESRSRRRNYEKRQKARANYGLTFAEYDALFADPRCHVCGSGPTGRWRRHHIDHDHATGKVRGLLCHECNCALGLAGEDPDRLRALAAYIEKHRETQWPVLALDLGLVTRRRSAPQPKSGSPKSVDSRRTSGRLPTVSSGRAAANPKQYSLPLAP